MDFYNNNNNFGQALVSSRQEEMRLPEWAKAENYEMIYSHKEIYNMMNGVEEKKKSYKVRASIADELRKLANFISPEIQVG